MPAHSAVGVDDDFAPGQPDIAVWPADLETPRRVDVNGHIIVPHRTKHRFDDVLDHRCVQIALFFVPFGSMLCGQDHCVDTRRLGAVVFERHLALCIGTKPGDGAVCLAHFDMLFDEPMGNEDR